MSDWEAIEAEARALVEAAEAAGLTLRVLGSTGVRLHSPAAREAMIRLGRQPKDIDLACPKRHRSGVRELVEARGYEVDRDVLIAMEGTRLCFTQPDSGIELDLFVDRLHFCHTIELDGRYGAHPLTLPAADLLLAKLQVHDFTRNDALDAAALLSAHPVEQLEPDYVAGLLAGDWGFHHTAVANLDALGAENEDARLAGNVAALRAAIDAVPKSLGWRMRARVGERKQWWQDVNEREQTY